MPRHANHQQRRHDLSAATVTVAGELGLAGVTVARIAQRAGVSVGLVQHYFPAKHDLLVNAHAFVMKQARDRVEAGVTQAEARGATIRAMMSAGLSQLLPTDAESRLEAGVRIQFHGLAVVDPALRAVAAAGAAGVCERIAEAIVNGRECGETAHGLDAEQAAWGLWCLVDGLAAALLQDDSAPASDLLQDAVRRVFPHPCRR